jgi:hypothetical protein
MIGEISLWGLYLPPLLLQALAALLLGAGARRLLAALNFYRWVWHPALFDTALYVLLLWGSCRAGALLQT